MADDEFTVFIDYANKIGAGTGNLQPNSHYNVDYILHHYEHMIEEKLAADPLYINNIDFKNFYKAISDFKEILNKARQNDTSFTYTEYVPIAGTNRNFKERISDTPANLALLNNHIATENIYNKYFDYFGANTAKQDSLKAYYYQYVIPPSNVATTYPKLLEGLQKIRTFYTKIPASLDKLVTTNEEEYLSNQLSNTVININKFVDFDAYVPNYSMIEKSLKNTEKMLNHIIEGSFSEGNAIINMPDPSVYYAHLTSRTPI